MNESFALVGRGVRSLTGAGWAAAAAGLIVLAGQGGAAWADEPAPAETPAAKDGAKAGEVDLPSRWVKGHQQRLELEVDRSVKVSSASLPMANGQQSIHQRIGMIMRLADVTDRAAVFNLFITDLDATVTLRDKEYTFDSSLPSVEDKGNPLAEAMRPLVGVTIKVVVNERGEIVSSIGHYNAIVPGPFGMYAADLVGPEAIRRDWGPMLAMKPGEHGPVLGEQWETTEDGEMKGVGVFTLKSSSTFSDQADQLATVDAEGGYELKPETDASGGSKYRIGDSTYTGRYVWNTDDGIIHEATVDRKMIVIGTMGENEITIERDAKLTLHRVAMPKPPAHSEEPAHSPEKPAESPAEGEPAGE